LLFSLLFWVHFHLPRRYELKFFFPLISAQIADFSLPSAEEEGDPSLSALLPSASVDERDKIADEKVADSKSAIALTNDNVRDEKFWSSLISEEERGRMERAEIESLFLGERKRTQVILFFS
jgi:hypothetical protein